MTTRSETIRQPTILCVDDDPDVLRALERLLRRYGCRVLQASEGSSALDILEREQIEVLICDEEMPGMRGTEVLRHAKTISPKTVRVLLTAHCNDQAVVIPAVNEGGVFRLLSKPWEDREIRRAVADALGLEPAAWVKQRQRSQKLQDPDRAVCGKCETVTAASTGENDVVTGNDDGGRR